MKPSFFIAFGLFYCTHSLAQSPSSPSLAQPPTPQSLAQLINPLSTLSPVTIRLNAPDDKIANSLFRHFEVIDERPDTTRIGLHYALIRLGKPHNRQLIFSQPASRALSDYLDKYYSRSDAPYTLLIVLRNLWLSDAKYLREDVAKNHDKVYEKTHARVRMEIYAARDSLYMPLYRLDTLVITRHLSTYDLTNVYSVWNDNLAALLNEMADSAMLVTQRKQGQTRLVSRDDILQYNQSRFTNPIDSGFLNTGVYKNFEEFKNNAPSIKEFEVRTEKSTRLLYIKEGGTSYYSHNAWGYCDGKNIYIMRDGILNPVWREGKAWYFNGETDFDIPEYTFSNNGTNMAAASRREVKRTRIFTLDIDNDTIY